MRILIRTSRLATWARRFGSFALPLAVIPVFLHRGEVLDSETFALVEAIAMFCALMGLMLGIGAYIRLWFTGDRGWGRASTGIVTGLICLSPLVYGAYLFANYPSTSDITSDPAIPVALPTVEDGAPAALTPGQSRTVFPNIGPRRYQIGTNDLYRIVGDLVGARGWDVLRRQAPQLEDATGQIDAVDMTWLGWRDEIAVRVTGDFSTARVAVRSASRAGVHDLGHNGRRVDAFLADLDAAVTEALLNAPADGGPPVPLGPRPDAGAGQVQIESPDLP